MSYKMNFLIYYNIKILILSTGVDEQKYMTRLRMGVIANIAETSKNVSFSTMSQHLNVMQNEIQNLKYLKHFF
jgi:hypothetical protein